MNYWDDYNPGYEDEFEPNYESDHQKAIDWAKEIHSKIKLLLESRKSVIYNAAFDQRILRQQCLINNLPEINFAASCAMLWYSQYCGDWNDYHQNYRWQRLPGGDHSAIGDCRATLAVIQEMANG